MGPVDLPRLEQGGTLIVNEDAFDERNLEKAEYASNPLEDGTVSGYRVIKVPMTSLTKDACEPLGVKPRDAERSKNFFALGLVSFMYTRPVQPTLDWIAEKFGKNEQVAAANTAAFKAGLHFGETTEQAHARFTASAFDLFRRSLERTMTRGVSREDYLAANLIGTPDQVCEKVAAFERAGLDHFCASLFVGNTVDELLEQMRVFARYVLPAFPDRGPSA